MPFDRQQLAALACQAAVTQGGPDDRRDAVADEILAGMQAYLAQRAPRPPQTVQCRDPETGLPFRVPVDDVIGVDLGELPPGERAILDAFSFDDGGPSSAGGGA